MYKKILVSLDMSPMNLKIFDQGLSLAKTHQASLFLLHVLSPEEDASPLPVPPSFSDIYTDVGNEVVETWHQQWQIFEQQGEHLLESFAKQAQEASVSVEWKQLIGSPGKNICRQAQEWNADLIVIGRRGHSGIREMLLGSVSNYVMHHAHCCLLVVQHLNE